MSRKKRRTQSINTGANVQSPAPVQKTQQYSVKEIAKLTDEEERRQAVFDAVKNAITLRNIVQNESQTFTVYSKANLRQYLKNPKNFEANLRYLSQFLYRMSYPYRRIINYFATMVDLSAMIVVPKVNMNKSNSASKIMKDYEKVLLENQKMNMKSQILKLLTIAWREDTVYAYAYEDEDGFFLLPLDGAYCKISSQNMDGSYNFAFDFSYFRTHQSLLEYWDDEFNRMYQLYINDNTLRWQELDPARSFCLKINGDDPLLSLPPFVSLFEAIIDLVDLQSIQAVKDELSAYKLLVMEEEVLDKATEPDQFKVDLDSAIEYYNKMAENLPPEVSSCISLLPIKTIEFKGTTSEDVDMVNNSMSNLFKAAGVSQILDRNKIEGSVAFTAAMISDTVMALTAVLPQIEVWVNRYINYSIGNVSSRIKYLPVSPYTKDNYLSKVMNAAEYGVPVKMQAASLLNLDPLETYSMEYLENEVLKIHESWLPLNSSHTQSGNTTNVGGRPQGTTSTGVVGGDGSVETTTSTTIESSSSSTTTTMEQQE